MKKTLLALPLLLGCPMHAAVIASNDFDTSLNLNSSSSSPIAFNGFSSGGDAWGIYSYPIGGPFDLFDDSNPLGGVSSGGGSPFPTDSLGIVQSTKTDSFFGINDTTNGDVANGEMTGDFVFDVSSAVTLTSIDISFAGMGDFEATSDFLTISYSIDGSGFTPIFTSSVDEAAAADYTMEDGDVITLNDPMSINGVELTNSFQSINAAISGSGSELTLRVFADTNGSEPLGLDDVVINGTIPEPTTSLLGALGLAALLRRRR